MAFKLNSIALAVAGVVALGASAVAQEKVRWKMHAAFGENVKVLGPPPHRVADAVEKMSGGNFKIRVFEPGALTGGYAYYDPVSQGAGHQLPQMPGRDGVAVGGDPFLLAVGPVDSPTGPPGTLDQCSPLLRNSPMSSMVSDHPHSSCCSPSTTLCIPTNDRTDQKSEPPLHPSRLLLPSC